MIETSTPALEISELSKSFGAIRVLSDVAFTVRPGTIHGLLGENGSGKSTVIKILAGYHVPDPTPTVSVWGQELEFPLKSGASHGSRMSFVHQDLGLIPDISIRENLFMLDIVDRSRRLSRRDMRLRTQETLDTYGIRANPDDPVAAMGLGDRALLAIARSFIQMGEADGPALLVLDEPTTSMSRAEKDVLHVAFRQLADQGHSLLLVSHDLDEIMDVTDDATVLRDGVVAGTVRTSDTLAEDVVALIIGGEAPAEAERRLVSPDRTQVAFSYAPSEGEPLVVHQNEIVGVTGVTGSGFGSVNARVFGADPAGGELHVGEHRIALATHTPKAAVGLGFGLVPLERDRTGVSGELSVVDNLTVQLLRPKGRSFAGLISRNRLRRRASADTARYGIKAPQPELALSNLSGGNRQKVLLAKWLTGGARYLLLDEPTQAVDLGAHADILNLLRGFADGGGSVLIGSADWGQLAAVCDRVLVFGGGTVREELTGEFDRKTIGDACYRWGTRSGSAPELSEGVVA